MNGRPISNTRKMNKYLGLGLVLLASSACSKDTIEQPQQPTAPSEGVTISLEAKQPEFVDLDDEFRAVEPNVTVNNNGYPIIQLPEEFGSQGLAGAEVRWRFVNKQTPDILPKEQRFLPNGASSSNGDMAGNTGYASTMGADYGRVYVRTITEGGKQKLRVFLPFSAKTTPLWGDAEHDLYVFISTGLNAARGFEGAGGQFITGGGRVKLYYTGASGGKDYSNMYKVGNMPPTTVISLNRKAVVADATTPYQQYFPYMTTYRKANLYAKSDASDPAQVNASATYALAGVDNGVLEPRGTILSFNFANVTSSPVVVTDIELKNDAFAYDGYFSGAGALVEFFHGGSDGIAPEGVMTGTEVQAQGHTKFVETNLTGFSQYSFGLLKQRNPSINYPGIPTSASYGVYADGTTTDKGITIESGQKSGRIFLWGYPKGDGKTALRVKVTYVVNGVKTYAYQRVNAPAEGFQEGKAYLKTIRIGKATSAVSKLTDVATPTDWATFQ